MMHKALRGIEEVPYFFKVIRQIRRSHMKFDGWPSKTIGHLFYANSSFVHHFNAIG